MEYNSPKEGLKIVGFEREEIYNIGNNEAQKYLYDRRAALQCKCGSTDLEIHNNADGADL